MNIWLMQTGEPLPIKKGVRKMRSALLADKLLEHGHKVLWWASAFEHQRKIMIFGKDASFAVSEAYTIRVLRGCRYHKNISFLRYLNYQIISSKFRLQSKKFAKPDVIVVSMPDHLLAYEAARYAEKNNIPFVVDIRDLWPDILINRFKGMGLYIAGKLILALDFAKLLFLLKNADSLVAVSKGYLHWGLKKIGRTERPLDKISYLGYKKTKSKLTVNRDENPYIPDWLKRKEKQKLFLFVGTFGYFYELELILKAASRFEKLGKMDICFIIAGEGDKYDILEKKAAGFQNVVLPGWIEEKDINVLLGMGYAGLLSYVKSAPQGLPNKPFEYLSAGLPVINSLEGEMAELVDQYGFGLNYKPSDLEGLCQCIEQLAADSGLHDEMSRNALFFFEKYGDADKIYDEYAMHIELLARSCHKTG